MILDYSSAALRIEDRQIGQYYLRPKKFDSGSVIAIDDIKNKLFLYLWENIFSTNKRALGSILAGSNLDVEDVKVFEQFIKDVSERLLLKLGVAE